MTEIRLRKNKLMIDEPLNIKVYTSEPEQQVTIRMEVDDDEQKTFHSYGDFTSDESYEIDLNSATPENGTYQQADGAGLLWSMISKKINKDDYFVKKSDKDLEATLYVTADDKIQATEVITLQFRDDSVEKIELDNPDIKGSLYAPKKPGDYPAVIILSGSDGGSESHAASFLAGEGYLVLALSYFNDEGLNEHLEKVDLAYFKLAADYLSNHEKSNGSVNLIGYSKGAELALLLGSIFNCFQSIIAGSASNYVTSGMKGGIFAPVPGWMLDGKPLPYLKMKFPVSFMFSTIKNYIRKQPMYFLEIWKKSLGRKSVSEFKISVDKIGAPLLIISGSDDKLWPSGNFNEEIQKERDNGNDLYLSYKKAGHFISFPYNFYQLPANIHMDLDGMIIDFGGTKYENAKAAEDSLEKILAFLRQNNG
ncbi:acyl-CoA thioesterase/bile acid-CoA:amino acid N-acyltransferase family protein [Salinicoccus sp. YB14-2]|uniref:acyl-CoA thioesterase/bile acid-CoA:amino acid N-acyltransferase family protein n=1 Tax=Salinicoccus sp. YB14-2 TaxID=1572701 RepID=UPI00068FD0B4|nr:acyl-CoA thioester hydrolase/BAAT C-terminal domain-containing protein [Salinicoccus sp. YB14-2]